MLYDILYTILSYMILTVVDDEDHKNHLMTITIIAVLGSEIVLMAMILMVMEMVQMVIGDGWIILAIVSI